MAAPPRTRAAKVSKPVKVSPPPKVAKPATAKAKAVKSAAPPKAAKPAPAKAKKTKAAAAKSATPAKPAKATRAAVPAAPKKPVARRAAPAVKAAAPKAPKARASRPAPTRAKAAASRSPKLSDAIKAFEAAVKVFHRGNFATARESFEKIVKSYPSYTEIVARVQMYLNICNRRLQTPARVPQTPDSLYNQGVLEMNRAHYDAAIDLFKRALKSQPHQPHVLYSLAAAQVRLGETDEGLKTLERAVEGKELHRSKARHDPDFAALRDDARFQELVGLGYNS